MCQWAPTGAWNRDRTFIDESIAAPWRVPNRNELPSLSDHAPTFPPASRFNGQPRSGGAVTTPAIFGQYIGSPGIAACHMPALRDYSGFHAQTGPTLKSQPGPTPA